MGSNPSRIMPLAKIDMGEERWGTCFDGNSVRLNLTTMAPGKRRRLGAAATGLGGIPI